jgi:hypothetical protein
MKLHGSRRSSPHWAAWVAAAVLGACAGPEPRREAQRSAALEAVAATLDRFHAAAARADGSAYFAELAREAVFLGTDATERWDVAAFRAYAEPYFARGQGWTFVPLERHVSLSADAGVAWFDERLDNVKYGETRGSGVLVRQGQRWLIAHYVLSFAVPNQVSLQLVELVRARDAAAETQR